jgi:hypothetical protein
MSECGMANCPLKISWTVLHFVERAGENKIGNVNSSEYTNMTRAGPLLRNIEKRGSILITHCCVTITLVMRVTCFLRKTPQTDMDGHIRCSSLTIEREENLKGLMRPLHGTSRPIKRMLRPKAIGVSRLFAA